MIFDLLLLSQGSARKRRLVAQEPCNDDSVYQPVAPYQGDVFNDENSNPKER